MDASVYKKRYILEITSGYIQYIERGRNGVIQDTSECIQLIISLSAEVTYVYEQ